MSQRSGVGAALGSALLWTLAACGPSPRHAGELPDSPQAALEQQLRSGRHRVSRGPDGGLLYTTDFSTTSPEPLRVPYDMLQLECEQHGGRFEPVARAQTTAESLAGEAISDRVVTVLREADARQLFGEHRCAAGSNVWVAELEPVAVEPTRDPLTARLQLYVRATPVAGDDGAYDPNAPPGPGLPDMGGARGAGAAASSTPDRKQAPLDPPLLRPPGSGDGLLADPQLYGVQLSVDTPQTLSQKLGVALDKAQACDAQGLTGLCWERPGNSQALALRAMFGALGPSSVLAELEVDYPADVYATLEHVLRNQFGAADDSGASATGAQALQWSWLHTSVELSASADKTRLRCLHRPSLDRAQLPKGAPARERPGAVKPAAPWQVELGYEPAQSAQARLLAAGFSVPERGCSDGGTSSSPVFIRTCPLQSTRAQGVRSAWVRSVDIGDGRPRVAELGVQLDPAVWSETLRDLKTQYGEPIPSQGDALQWWTGPVGITLTAEGPDPSLRYYHGRLLQFFLLAEKRGSASKTQP